MILKPGVDAVDVDPRIWFFLGIIALEHKRWTGVELVVTSLRRPQGDRPSRHFAKPGELVTAADVRRHYLDSHNLAEAFARWLQGTFGYDLGVVLEPDWLTGQELSERGGILHVDPHIHVQLKREDWPRA